MSMENIEHVVVLMLENRSLDSMLGWAYETGAPNVVIPAGSVPGFDGLPGIDLANFTNRALGGQLNVPPIRGAEGYNVPTIDPGEEYEHVNQQFFNPPTASPPNEVNMLGYVADFVSVMHALKMDPSDIVAAAPQVMQSYTPAQLPVLNQLARAYAVSDAWYASVPSQTNPNRAFLMCGTSNGMVNNGDLEDPTSPAKTIESHVGMAIGDDRIDAPTIFNALDTHGTSWGVFYQTSYLPQKISTLIEYAPAVIAAATLINPALGAAIGAAWLLIKPYSSYLEGLSSGKLESCYTWRLFPQIQHLPNAADKFQSLASFHQRAQAGTLPAFSYIEPFWTISQATNNSSVPKNLVTALGNDYHPPSNLLVGEAFLKAVYTSLISNQAAWNKTVLLITFDEFVGTFDHGINGTQEGLVAPPWGIGGTPPFQSCTGFDFRRLGGRVPAIIVSPYVQAGTVFRADPPPNSPNPHVPYDHTSVIATVLNWTGHGGDVGTFGQRAANAPTFEGVLTLDAPRTDAAGLPFVDKVHRTGDPVSFGDSFLLVNQNGHSITTSVVAPKAGTGAVIPNAILPMLADLELAAYFPTWGKGTATPLSFVSPGIDGAGQVNDGESVLLVTREASVGAMNILGSWADSHDCYWYNQYFGGPHAAQQSWRLHKTKNPGHPLAFGDQITLVNGAEGTYLQPDDRLITWGNWLATGKSSSTWTVMPAPVVLPGH